MCILRRKNDFKGHDRKIKVRIGREEVTVLRRRKARVLGPSSELFESIMYLLPYIFSDQILYSNLGEHDIIDGALTLAGTQTSFSLFPACMEANAKRLNPLCWIQTKRRLAFFQRISPFCPPVVLFFLFVSLVFLPLHIFVSLYRSPCHSFPPHISSIFFNISKELITLGCCSAKNPFLWVKCFKLSSLTGTILYNNYMDGPWLGAFSLLSPPLFIYMLKRSPLFHVQRELRDEEMGGKVESVAVKGCKSRNQYWINGF